MSEGILLSIKKLGRILNYNLQDLPPKPGGTYILHELLVDRQKIKISPLHIKLYLMKQFLKT